MRTNRFTLPSLFIFSLTTLSTTGCARTKESAEPAAPVLKDTAASVPAPSASVPATPVTSPDFASAKWADIEENSYDMRVAFFAGLKRLEAKVDFQIGELAAKRATATSNTDTKDWDFAMKEMENARAALKSTGEEAGKATPETWQQQKGRVGEAWTRTQTAYAKVKSSTTR